ncbi:MAG: metal ABC transporter permease, partial [Microthrixaceae bacterium]
LFALVVTPPATALKLTARPSRVVLFGTAIGLASVIFGLITATIFNLPPSFFIVTYSFLTWLVVLVATRERHRVSA